MSGWLCQCGKGNLLDHPPEYCDLCGFSLWEYFGLPDDEEVQA